MIGLKHVICVKLFLHSKVTSRADGEVLREHLLRNWDSVDSFELDFNGLQVASVSFLDEAFGMLAEHYGKKEILQKVKTQNVDELDQKMLDSILRSRLSQFKKGKKTSDLTINGH